MKIQFPPNSPVFIFPFSNTISEEQIITIVERSNDFLNQWKSHGDDVFGKVFLEERQFLIFVVDPSYSNPSGCSKDKLYHFLENLTQTQSLELGNSNKFWVKHLGKIEGFSKKEIKDKLAVEMLSYEDQLFPTWISDYDQYLKSWGKPIFGFQSIFGNPKIISI